MIFKNYKEIYKDKGGIYKIIANGLIYIGRTKNLYQRYLQHIQSFKDFSCNNKFKILISNGGNPDDFVFEVLETDGGLLLQIREEYYIKLYNSVENGLNIIHNDDEFFKMFNKNKINFKAKHKRVYKSFTYKILCEYEYKKRIFKEDIEIKLPHTLIFYKDKKLASLLKKRIEKIFNIKSVKVLAIYRDKSEITARELNYE